MTTFDAPPGAAGGPTMSIEEYAASFDEEPGYLDFARVGPIGRSVVLEQQMQTEVLSRSRFGSLDVLQAQDERVRRAAGALVGVPAEQVVFQPNTSTGLMHTMFGLTGSVLLSPAEFPSITFAASRASEALGVVSPVWLETDRGRVTPARIREQLTPQTVAVAVSLVDSRTGYLVDLEGIRQVIGDRLLIVDAIQGFGVVDAPFGLADVVVTGGQKWVRAGWGTGFMSFSERALAHLTPVFSGFTGTAIVEPFDFVPEPERTAKAFSVSNADAVAQARLATALEDISSVGVPAINAAITERVSEIIDLADEFGLAIASSRDESERAGIVVVEPTPDQQTTLTAALFNHGVTAKIRPGSIRFSAHVSTDDDTLVMLRSAFMSFGTGLAY